jgi:hypothetical protein
MSTMLHEFYNVHELRRPSQQKDWKGMVMAVVLQAAVVEATPSKQVEVAGHAKICPRQLSRDLRLASRLCTSICGLTT